MAKTLTSNIIRNKSRRYGTEPINLLDIQFGGAIGTKYYSDRVVTVGGNTYEAVVKDWGDIDFILNKSASVSDLHIVLLNTLSSPISNLFSTEAPESKIAILYQWYIGEDAADKTPLFSGRITSPVEYSLDSVSFDIVGRILDLEAKIGRVITQAEFPRSLVAHRGKIIPQVIGSVQNVPAVCIYTAGKSSLRETLTDSALTIEVDDGSVFPTDASWTLVIEEEQILMEANTSGGNTLTATQRAYLGSIAALHTKGTQMYEKASTFRYQVFDDQFSVKAAAISGVRVNGFLLNDSQYTIDQVNYPGQIIFNSYPQVEEQQETDFDDYLFDVVVNDESTPYAHTPEALIDENTSSYAWLLSGQRVELQRSLGFSNINQLKRTYLEITYFTDRREWNGEIQARVFWDDNDLGLLPDPTFDIQLEDELRVVNNPGDVVLNPFNPVPIGGYGEDDTAEGPESVPETTFYKEDTVPSSLDIETPTFNPLAYTQYEGMELIDTVPPAYFTASVEGVIGKVTLFQHSCVGSNADTWEGDSANFEWIDWVFSGFSFSPPSKNGTARITGVTITFNHQFKPSATGSYVKEFRVRRKGEEIFEPFTSDGFRMVGLRSTPLYVHEIEEFQVVFRTSTYIHTRTSWSVEERNPLTAELWGTLQDVSAKIDYEIVPDPPEEEEEEEEEDEEITIPKPDRVSHEVVKSFEITDFVGDWDDLLNKSAEVVFESDGALPGTNLFVKKMQVKTESGRYVFQYTDEITADVDGFYVDGSEITTDYGIDGELITRPDQVFKLLLTWNSLFSLSDIDATFYNVAALYYINQYYRVDFAIVEEITLREVLEKIAFQLRTDQYWEAGKHRLKVLQVATSVTKQVTAADIEKMTITRSAIEELINLLEVRYSIDYSFLVSYTPNKFRDIISIENPGSQSDYGVRKSLDKTFYFDCIRDDITASHVANYYLSFYSVVRRYVRMKCFLNQLELDKHDIVGVTFPLDSLSNTPGRVLSNKLEMGGKSDIDQIELYVLMEDYTYHQLSLTDGVSFSEAIQLAVVPLVSLADGVEFSDAIYFGFEANLIDTVGFSESFSYNMHKTLFIREGYSGGWGEQSWGISAWGGDDTSFNIGEVLSILKIAAEGTGFINASDVFSINEQLVLQLVHRVFIADNDEFNMRVLISENLSINIV